ncbi:MAG: manganese efflux pump [Lachnospiraceae bacterium]
MNTIEELIIIIGISLDIFAVMECQGSLVAKIEKKQLMLLCIILVIGQAFALGMGDFISVLLCRNRIETYEVFLGQVLAATVFLCLGIRLLLKAWRNERIIERREEQFDVWEFVKLYARTSIFTLLTGVAFGFLKSSMIIILILIAVMTVIVTVFGMYTGYRLGFEHKIKAYLTGGILLIAAGIDVIVHYILNII